MREGESSVFDGGLTKIMDCIVPIRDSREFKRGETEYMHCIVPRESSGVEGFSGSVLLNIQLLPKFFLDSDFCHNYLHTPVILN